MGRQRARTDDNQKVFCNRMRRSGAGVIVTSMLTGKYTFDTIVAYRGKLHLVELKNMDDLPKYFFEFDRKKQRDWLVENRLTDNEINTLELLEAAGCELVITYSADHCLREIGGLPRPFEKN